MKENVNSVYWKNNPLKNKELTFDILNLQSNLISSNIDGLFTLANSNSFEPFNILLIAQENK